MIAALMSTRRLLVIFKSLPGEGRRPVQGAQSQSCGHSASVCAGLERPRGDPRRPLSRLQNGPRVAGDEEPGRFCSQSQGNPCAMFVAKHARNTQRAQAPSRRDRERGPHHADRDRRDPERTQRASRQVQDIPLLTDFAAPTSLLREHDRAWTSTTSSRHRRRSGISSPAPSRRHRPRKHASCWPSRA
jgi:hypothetical protein